MRAQKLRRGWIVAVASTSIAALSHSLAGGHYPSFILWALCTALAAIICVGLAGTNMPRLALGASVTFAQAIFHCIYGLAGKAIMTSAATGAHAHGAHLTGTTHAPHHTESPLMLVLHALAALATYVLIRQADGVIAALKALTRNPWRKIYKLRELPALPQRIVVIQSQYVSSLTGLLLRYCGLLRGPPVAVN